MEFTIGRKKKEAKQQNQSFEDNMHLMYKACAISIIACSAAVISKSAVYLIKGLEKWFSFSFFFRNKNYSYYRNGGTIYDNWC